jgi:glycerol-1-phosphate dehydrogenase [NAD(P)+]
VRRVVIGTGLAASAEGLLAPLGLGPRPVLVMDPDTKAAMGDAVAAALGGGAAAAVVLGRHPHPDMDTVARIEAAIASGGGASALIAVGSGTVNDVAKYAAHRMGLPYAVFGTAPSMNGYTSVSAAITDHGHKKSLAATAPRGVFLDLGVLAAAPSRLIAAGFGDSICRCTAQADWLAAHVVFGTPYRAAPFMLLAEDEPGLIARAGGLRAGDRDAIAALARTLVLSGFGMTICGGSQPASQAEHLISHYLEMMGPPQPAPALHGEQIAVTTLMAARLQAKLWGGEVPPALGPDTLGAADFSQIFGDTLGLSCWEAFRPKLLSAEAAAAANSRLAAEWPALKAALGAIMRAPREIEAALRAAGAPTDPAEIGIGPALYRRAVVEARLIRDRFTCLDFAASAGLLAAPGEAEG